MKSPWLVSAVVAVALATLALAAWGARVIGDGLDATGLSLPDTAPRSGETAAIVRTVATAISYPRQSSADGFARAAQATTAAEDGRLTVVEATPTDAPKAGDPVALLVFRIHLPGNGDGFGAQPEVTYCYRAEFSSDGLVDEPRRVGCPPDAASVTPPPAPAEPRVPVGADRVVASALRAGGDVHHRVSAGVRRLTATPDLPPRVHVTGGEDIGVAVSAPGTCLLGRRVADRVRVWYVPRAMAQPRELSCSAETALAGLGRRAPH